MSVPIEFFVAGAVLLVALTLFAAILWGTNDED